MIEFMLRVLNRPAEFTPPPLFVNLCNNICSNVVMLFTFAKTWTEIMNTVDETGGGAINSARR